MVKANSKNQQPIVLTSSSRGIEVISEGGSLTRLHYFDGKFLRADDLLVEQQYLRRLTMLSNRAGGAGVVEGFDAWLAGGDKIHIGEGMAIDREGHIVLLPQAMEVSIAELIQRSAGQSQVVKNATDAAGDSFVPCDIGLAGSEAAAPQTNLFLVTVGWVEAACGVEDVYGKPCEAPCSSSTDRPYRIEGVVFRAVRLEKLRSLVVSTAFPLGPTHLRSRVVSAYFADEAAAIPSLVSGAGLMQKAFCLGAREAHFPAEVGSDVPIALIARSGSTTLFLDPWAARRERMESPPRRYWAHRMRMRPWDIFLAQVLQFQCQLVDLLANAPTPQAGVDPCANERALISKAATTVNSLNEFAAKMVELGMLKDAEQFAKLAAELAATQEPKPGAAEPGKGRVLLRGGIVELPSAGYLPIDVGSALSVNEQVLRLLGEGVDLRFCVTTPDYVAHALEEAQHMDRISLVHGLDHPDEKPEIDVLVPDGRMVASEAESRGLGFEVRSDIDVDKLQPTLEVFVEWLEGQLGTAGGDPTMMRAPEAPAVAFWPFAARVAPASAVRHPESELGMIPAPVRSPVHAKVEAAARAEALATGGGAFYLAGTIQMSGAEGGSGELWLKASCDRDPFTIGYAGSAGSSVEFKLLGRSPRGELLVVEGTGFGSLNVLGEVTKVGEESRLRVRFAGHASLKTQLESNPARSENRPLSLVVELARTSRSFGIRLLDARNVCRLYLGVTWDGKPGAILAKIGWTRPYTEFSGDLAALTENAAIFRADNVDHVRAVDVLKKIGDALLTRGGDPMFRATAERLLFGDDPETNKVVVHPTRDWVLFHRRRVRTCALPKAPVETPKPVVEQVYRIYHASVESDAELERLISQVRHQDADFRTTLVTQTVFKEGSAGLQASILAAWKQVSPGPTLVYGAITSPAGSEKIALDRLASMAGGTAPTSVLREQPKSLLETASPSKVWSPGQADGAALLVTMEVPKTVTHRVYRPTIPLEEVSGQYSDIDRCFAVATKYSKEIGAIVFQQGTDTLIDGDEQLTKIATALGNENIGDMLVIWHKDLEPSGNETLYAQRAEVIPQKLSKPRGGLDVHSSEKVPADQPAAIFLFPPPLAGARVYVIQTHTQLSTFMKDDETTAALIRELHGLSPVQIGTVAFEKGTPVLVSSRSNVTPLNGSTVNGVLALWQPNTETNGSNDLCAKRVKGTLAFMKIGDKAIGVKSVDDSSFGTTAIFLLKAPPPPPR